MGRDEAENGVEMDAAVMMDLLEDGGLSRPKNEGAE